MSLIVDMGIGFDDIEQVLDMSDLLMNSKELISKFEPSVTPFLVKKDFFKGPFLREYNNQFDELVRSLIKKELSAHFPTWTAEDILILTENTELLKMIAPELFDQDSYKKEKMN